MVKGRGALHSRRCSSRVQACHTRPTGASNTRVMTSVRRSAIATASFLAAMLALLFGFLRLCVSFFAFLRLQFLQIDIETIKAFLPEPAIVFEPVVHRLARIHLNAGRRPLSLAAKP